MKTEQGNRLATMYLEDKSQQLDEGIVEAVERAGEEIEELTGCRLTFSYTLPNGFNVYDASGFHSIYVMNFYLDGAYSTYDAWEYNDRTWDAMEPVLLRLIADLSCDGQVHQR